MGGKALWGFLTMTVKDQSGCLYRYLCRIRKVCFRLRRADFGELLSLKSAKKMVCPGYQLPETAGCVDVNSLK